MKAALSIAGSDSGGGAGIQADIKTFSALGVYGCTAITAITAQNTRNVSQIFPIPPLVIAEQISSVIRDFSPSAIKIGMVYNTDTISAVSRALKGRDDVVVLDPILAAGTGAKLLLDDAVDAFVSLLIPVCTLITPNRMEAERLSGRKISSEDDAIDAARTIMRLGAKNVIIKGGHFGRRIVTDILVGANGKVMRFPHQRVDVEETHGSGCNFSASAAAFLARGASVQDACKRANDYVNYALSNSVKVGRGLPVTNPLYALYRDSMKYRVVDELQKAVEQVVALDGFSRIIPETQTNFVFAMPDAKSTSDVAGVRGRIVKVGSTAVPVSCVELGASKHMASAVISYMSVNPNTRSAINIKYDQSLEEICNSLFQASSYDRAREPRRTKRKEGATMSWGIRNALEKNHDADIIYHGGDVGKEAMMNIFGETPAVVVEKVSRILKKYC